MAFLDPQLSLILLAAVAIDASLGDPDWLWRRIPHPAVLMGRLIGWLDGALNRGPRDSVKRLAGVAALGVLVLTMGTFAFALHWLFMRHPLGIAGEALLVAVLLAQRSLYEHVRGVFDAFARGGLPSARQAVAKIVGRDTTVLDESGVCRAAIETTAENFSDGVVAPAFWYLIAGLPGIVIYKAVNTADSMIGHRNSRYAAFGCASARIDDLLNLVPARLSGLIVVLASLAVRADARGAWEAMLRDARWHRSPNAGWPEAAMAGALGVAIAGPRRYPSGWIEDGWMNGDGQKALRPDDIARALQLFVAACAVQAVIIAGIAILTH